MFSGRRQRSKARDGTEEKPWLKQEDATWADEVAAWDWLDIGIREWEKSGQCPGCDHGMKVEQSGTYVGLPAAEAKGADRDFYARCNCGEEHPGRPAEIKQGCGRWGLINPPPRR